MSSSSSAVWGIHLHKFLQESLAIEGITRKPTQVEINATIKFIDEPLSVDTVIDLQKVYAPNMPLRDKPGMDVQVGSYVPPRGTPDMRMKLFTVLQIADPWKNHIAFESLHPFMDGNGRTGRAVWLWKMFDDGSVNPFSLPFLHRFYYQTLSNSDGRPKK